MTQRYAFWFSQPALDNRPVLCLFTVTLQLITMVGGVGVEPTHPEGTDLWCLKRELNSKFMSLKTLIIRRWLGT